MVRIEKVTKANIADLYAICTPPTEEYTEAKQQAIDLFLSKQNKKGWQGLILYEDDKPVGRVEIYPLEESFAAISGENLYFMPCIWIQEDYQKRKYGKMLIEEILKMTTDRKGVITVTVEGWMPKSFFEKMGFKTVKTIGPVYLMMKKHQEDVECDWLSSNFVPKNERGKVNIDIVMNHACPYMTVNYHNIIKKAKGISDKVEVTEYMLRERKDLEKYGEMNVYIDGETPFMGPAKDEEVEKVVKEHLRKKGL